MQPTLTKLVIDGPLLIEDPNGEGMLRFELDMHLDGLPENKERPEISGDAVMRSLIDVPVGASIGQVIREMIRSLEDMECYVAEDFPDVIVGMSPTDTL